MSKDMGTPPGLSNPTNPHYTWPPPSRISPLSVSRRRTLLVNVDISITLISVLLALGLWVYREGDPYTLSFILDHSVWFFVLPFLWFVLAQVSDYYSLRVTAHLARSLTRLAWITLALLVIYVATLFLSPRGSPLSRFIFSYELISLALIGLWRACRILLISGWARFRRRTLIVGMGPSTQLILQALKEEALRDYEVIGCIVSLHDSLASPRHLEALGTGKDLAQIVQNQDVSELLVAYVNEIPGDVFQGLVECHEKGIEIVPVPALYEEITGRIPIELVGEHLLALVLPLEEHSFLFNIYLFTKRLTDILLALLGLLLFVPIFPFIAFAIKLDSPGPIFYAQDRVGQGGKLFRIFKFRSMIDGAEALTGARWATAYDERVTRFGRIMRQTRLDEVPQLVNVLLGQMSLVGPRPERPEFVQILFNDIPFYRTRLVAKPGLTGWAQVRFRYGNSVQDALRKLEYDLYYIRHQSSMFDLIIAVKTIGMLLQFRGT